MVWALLEANLTVPALDAVFVSDVSRRAWLSSFVSGEMSFVVAWLELGG
jgi:hypothetical protein